MRLRIGAALVATLFFLPLNGFSQSAAVFNALPAVTVQLDTIAAGGLVRWTKNAQSGGRLAVQFPQVKLFDASGKLEWFGNPQEFGREMTQFGDLQKGKLPSQVKVRDIKSERSILGLPPVSTKGPVMVAYLMDPCPPCDMLLAPMFAYVDTALGKPLQVIKVFGD